MTMDETINVAVFEAMTVKLKDYCERRIGAGASDEQINVELRDLIPEINAWSRRQRTLMNLMLDDKGNEQIQ